SLSFRQKTTSKMQYAVNYTFTAYFVSGRIQKNAVLGILLVAYSVYLKMAEKAHRFSCNFLDLHIIAVFYFLTKDT
ncbi:MAG: hypothetical protein LUH46_02230, partial [Alistipes sp.]|nr:hypothetical protein [Alistipes sp.]